jgi:hypothetical protein
MRILIRTLMLAGLVLSVLGTAAAQWAELYSTYDTDVNGTTHNTAAVGVIRHDMFIALVSNATRCFMVPYVNADSVLGRVGTWEYGPPAGTYKFWDDGGFTQIQMERAYDLVATPDSFVYVANNDQNHNILVFKYKYDTLSILPRPGSETIMPRRETGSNGVYGIALDGAGYIYVCNDTTTGKTDDIKIYPPISTWADNPSEAPMRTVDLPDGVYKGIAVNSAGTAIYVSDYVNRKVYRYSGSRTTGYTKSTTFDFTMAPSDTVAVYTVARPGPIGLAYLNSKNILAVVCDVWGLSSSSTSTGNATYGYGKIYLLNPNSGAYISTDTTIAQINQAAWNLSVMGTYTARGDGSAYGNASGYTSTWDVKFDEQENLYSQSYFGWTVEKWKFNGTLPSFTGVEPIESGIPTGYRLEQNYPNPFNPTTQIEFAVPTESFVSMAVFDILGREVATLVREVKSAGSYRVSFDARGIPSGTYFVTMRAGEFTQTRSMVVVK